MPKFVMCKDGTKCKKIKDKSCKFAHYVYELSRIPYDPKNPFPFDLKNPKPADQQKQREAKNPVDMEQSLSQFN